MNFLQFGDRPLWVVLGVFAVAAAIVWIAGTRVAAHADQLATMTGIGHATIGLLLLAGITSLPEVAISLTAALEDSPVLAVNNLLGAIALQITLLALADAAYGKDALTVTAGSSVTLLQVAMNFLLLALFAVAVSVGDIPVLGAGAWTWGLLLAYGFSMWTLARAHDRQLWVARKTAAQKDREEERRRRHERHRQKNAGLPPGARDADALTAQEQAEAEGTLAPLLLRLAAGAAAILVAGFLLTRTGNAIAERTGLGQSFVGAVLMGTSSSLPEISTVLAAVRLRRYEMAISDIFGTALFNIGLVFVVDLVYAGPPVLNAVGRFSLVAALLGALLAAIYMIGLLERRDRTIARMGIDSFVAVLVYLGGLTILYQLR